MSRRKAIPLLVKLQVALREMGLSISEVNFDHQPPLALREWDPEAQDTIPPANDPEHIGLMVTKDHKRKTFGTPATTAGSDIHKIAKVRRLSRKEEEFRKRLLKPEDSESHRKSRWPKRPFPKRARV